MAVELFKPFVMKELVGRGIAHNIKNAKRMVEKLSPEVWEILEDVIKDHPVMLNRAPTLHRLGIQAFEPVLVEGRAIKLHPLVCTPFNADFDGDQMAIHLPLSPEAQAEARFLMLSVNNLLKPQDGKPVTVPTLDMVLGSYYLTMALDGEKGEGMYFKDKDEAIMAYENHDVGIHAKVYVRFSKEVDGVVKTKKVQTTVGRIIYNEGIPQDLGYVDRTDPEHEFDLEINFPVIKKNLGDIVNRCINVHGLSKSAEVLDYIKATGFKYSTLAGVTFSAADVKVPAAKADILAKAEEQVEQIRKQFKRGLITDEERYNAVINVWDKATNDVTEAMKENFDDLNPIFMMVQSGARGNMNQLRQIAGMRGLMASTTGRAVEIPIKSSFAEGLDALEYFISARLPELFCKHGQHISIICRHQIFLFPFHKARLNQFFNDCCPCCRCAKSFLFCIFGQFFIPCTFHRRKQGIFCVLFRWLCKMLRYKRITRCCLGKCPTPKGWNISRT